MEIKKHAYLAGPMSGIKFYNWPEFFRAAKLLREDDWVIENPAESDIINGVDPTLPLEEQDASREDLLREDFEIIVTKCKALILLPGWRDSVGARAECLVAHLSGLPIMQFTYSDEAWTVRKLGDPIEERIIGSGFTLTQIQPNPQVIVHDGHVEGHVVRGEDRRKNFCGRRQRQRPHLGVPDRRQNPSSKRGGLDRRIAYTS